MKAALMARVETAKTDEARWRAVLARDTSYDGQFVLGVVTTGIYCRPSCPARKPKRENARFFEDAAAAERAGFRACKRCCPDQVAIEAEVVWRVCRHIDAYPDDSSLESLGALVGYSPFHLQRLFKRTMRMSPRQYAQTTRLERLKTGLKAGKRVTDAIYEAGFGSSSAAYDGAEQGLGMGPAAYRQGGQGERIRYTVVDTSLGRLLIAGTDKGIAAVSLGEEDRALETFLKEEFPAAERERDDAGLQHWASEVVAEVEGTPAHRDLPLDIRATAFQRRVWEALRAIPPGETRTYREVAEAIGRPAATRAVARACATNRIAVLIPCHRVIRADGGLGGYRWGLARKAALLKREERQG